MERVWIVKANIIQQLIFHAAFTFYNAERIFLEGTLFYSRSCDQEFFEENSHKYSKVTRAETLSYVVAGSQKSYQVQITQKHNIKIAKTSVRKAIVNKTVKRRVRERQQIYLFFFTKQTNKHFWSENYTIIYLTVKTRTDKSCLQSMAVWVWDHPRQIQIKGELETRILTYESFR